MFYPNVFDNSFTLYVLRGFAVFGALVRRKCSYAAGHSQSDSVQARIRSEIVFGNFLAFGWSHSTDATATPEVEKQMYKWSI